MRRNLQALSSVLIPLCSEIGLSERLRLETLRAKWHEMLGHPLSDHTYPMTIERGSLLVNVDSPIWLQELRFAKTAFQRKLKGLSITDVRFRHGRTFRNSLSAEKDALPLPHCGLAAPPEKCSAQESIWIDGLTCELLDPELRHILRRIIEKALTRKSPAGPR